MQERETRVDGLRTRYLEEGEGPVLLLLHGALIGSSADVWDRTMGPLAAAGLRVIALDRPGYGGTDIPPVDNIDYQRKFVGMFMDAVSLGPVCMVGHSQSGQIAVRMALEEPNRVSRAIILGTASLLPPNPDAKTPPAAVEEGTTSEPTVEDIRRLTGAQLYHQDLLTPEVLQQRLALAVGKNFDAFTRRRQTSAPPRPAGETPLWRQVGEHAESFFLIYGREDRPDTDRRCQLAQEMFPGLRLAVLDHCKHLVQWDAPDEFVRLTIPFALEGTPMSAR